MADGLYIGMAAATARSQQLEAIADNLANAETPGFKAQRPAFQAFLAGAGPTDKVFSAAVATGIDTRAGLTQLTENPLDVVPDGDGYIGVMMAGGKQAFTRSGSLQVGPNGMLLAHGLPVMSTNGEPIVVPPETVPSVQEDGTVVAEGRAIGQVAQFQLQGALNKVGPALLQPGPGGSAQLIKDGRLRIGELEMGNAPPLEAAVQMIGAQRHFETAMQAISTYKRMDDRAIEMGRVR